MLSGRQELWQRLARSDGVLTYKRLGVKDTQLSRVCLSRNVRASVLAQGREGLGAGSREEGGLGAGKGR